MAYSHINYVIFHTKNLQQFCGNNFSFIKDSKSPVGSRKDHSIVPGENLRFFDACALFTSIPVAIDLKLIRGKFTEHAQERRSESFLKENMSHFR